MLKTVKEALAVELFPSVLAGGLSIAVMGSPGTGKSTLAGSAAALGKTVLLAPKPRETNSWKYRENAHNITREIYYDAKWNSVIKNFEADAFVRLQQRVYALMEDTEHQIVIVDPFTDVVTLASHELLKGEQAATPRDLRDPLGFYGSLKHLLLAFTQSLTMLQFAPVPKHVIVTVHTQPAKEEQQVPRSQGGGNKPSADKVAQGVEFEGQVLPMIEGAYRRAFAGEFDMVCFTDIVFEKALVHGKMEKTTRYVLQVQPDAERHAKSVLGPVAHATVENDFAAILRLISGGAK